MNQDKYRVLRKKLDVLNPVQFQAMIADLLDPTEQDDLSPPVTKSSFLNDMDRWGKLDEVKGYMQRKFSEGDSDA